MNLASRLITHRKKNNTYLAAIDIGTNSFHLVVVEILADGKFKIIDRAKENVRLGHGGKDMKLISPEAMQRGVAALKRYAGIAQSFNAPIRAVATSAVREALNQAEFVKRIHDATGIDVEIVSGVEEARLIYLGILQALPVFDNQILMIDIGGGSVEYLIGKRGEAVLSNSLKLGHIRLTERFFKRDSLREKDIETCREHIRGFLSSLSREMRAYKYDFAIGSSGTIQNVANMIKGLRGEILNTQLNNFSFTRDELSEIVKMILKAKTPKDRLKIRGLDPKRADVIVAGAMVLEESFKALRIKRLTVSEFALREGIIYDYLQNRIYQGDHAHHLANIRYKSVQRLSELFHNDAKHAEHTVRIALSLFDQLKSLHKLGEREREFLEYATILHEIGFFVSHAQHHRHSYYLIRNSELSGFTDHEKEIIANIARYHRKSHPKTKHEGFAALAPKDQLLVRKLSGLLRIADGLDRTHNGVVASVKCKIEPRRVILIVRSGVNLELEMWAVNMKKGLFEEVFHKQIILKSY
ncbi:Ppx/GppA family phosphatase [bacterium]|nr:Ppx/GppA family phosphatase [bacterium]